MSNIASSYVPVVISIHLPIMASLQRPIIVLKPKVVPVANAEIVVSNEKAEIKSTTAAQKDLLGTNLPSAKDSRGSASQAQEEDARLRF